MFLLSHAKDTGCVNSWSGKYVCLFQNMNTLKKVSEISVFVLFDSWSLLQLRAIVTSNSITLTSHRWFWSFKFYIFHIIYVYPLYPCFLTALCFTENQWTIYENFLHRLHRTFFRKNLWQQYSFNNVTILFTISKNKIIFAENTWSYTL